MSEERKTEDLLEDVGIAVNAWLYYQTKLKKQAIMGEYFMQFPIAEYLNMKEGADLKTEESHPVFERRRIDFVFNDVFERPNEEEGEKRKKVAIEAKWVRQNTKYKDEHQRIVNDLLRLAYLLREKPDEYSRAFFLAGGLKTHFTKSFQQYSTPPNNEMPEKESTERNLTASTFSPFLAFSPTQKPISFNTGDENVKAFHDSFLKEYSPEKEETFATESFGISTKLIYKTGLDAEFLSAVGVWEVGLAQ